MHSPRPEPSQPSTYETANNMTGLLANGQKIMPGQSHLHHHLSQLRHPLFPKSTKAKGKKRAGPGPLNTTVSSSSTRPTRSAAVAYSSCYCRLRSAQSDVIFLEDLPLEKAIKGNKVRHIQRPPRLPMPMKWWICWIRRRREAASAQTKRIHKPPGRAGRQPADAVVSTTPVTGATSFIAGHATELLEGEYRVRR